MVAQYGGPEMVIGRHLWSMRLLAQGNHSPYTQGQRSCLPTLKCFRVFLLILEELRSYKEDTFDKEPTSISWYKYMLNLFQLSVIFDDILLAKVQYFSYAFVLSYAIVIFKVMPGAHHHGASLYKKRPGSQCVRPLGSLYLLSHNNISANQRGV